MECKLKQGTIYYETYGDGRPMLVLHGGYLDHRHMVSAIEPLFERREGWKRIYPDLPGHGRSDVAGSVSTHDVVLNGWWSRVERYWREFVALRFRQ